MARSDADDDDGVGSITVGCCRQLSTFISFWRSVAASMGSVIDAERGFGRHGFMDMLAISECGLFRLFPIVVFVRLSLSLILESSGAEFMPGLIASMFIISRGQLL